MADASRRRSGGENAAAPINPADLNQIEGKYPVRPELPATPGFEGAGVVVELGAEREGPNERRARNPAA